MSEVNRERRRNLRLEVARTILGEPDESEESSSEAAESEESEAGGSEDTVMIEETVDVESDDAPYDGPSRPSISVYAERMADRLEDYVQHHLVTDQPAEHLAEILAYVVKRLVDKGYKGLQPPAQDANRTAAVGTIQKSFLMDTVSRYYTRLERAKQKRTAHISSGHSDSTMCDMSGKQVSALDHRMVKPKHANCAACVAVYRSKRT